MPGLQKLLDFLELRPVFALRAVQVFWWLYIFERLYRTNWRYLHTVAGRSPPDSYWRYDWFEWLFTPLRTLVALATVRLLLDVLLALLMPSSQQTSSHPSLGQELLAFVDLRASLTRWWVQVFWWLFLLTTMRAIYPYFLFGNLWSLGSYSYWSYFINGIADQLLWLIGVRLLVEVALMPPAPAPKLPVQSEP